MSQPVGWERDATAVQCTTRPRLSDRYNHGWERDATAVQCMTRPRLSARYNHRWVRDATAVDCTTRPRLRAGCNLGSALDSPTGERQGRGALRKENRWNFRNLQVQCLNTRGVSLTRYRLSIIYRNNRSLREKLPEYSRICNQAVSACVVNGYLLRGSCYSFRIWHICIYNWFYKIFIA